MRVATVGGLVTLFYDGSKELYNRDLEREWDKEEEDTFYDYNKSTHWENWNLSDECKNYFRERLSWQQVIVVDGVTVIPESTFYRCKNIERVIFADTVIRIEQYTFCRCRCLSHIKWSINLEYIGYSAFNCCDLSLEILNVPQPIELGDFIFRDTKLLHRSPFHGRNYDTIEFDVNPWLKSINNDEQFALHRVCSSFQPTLEMILQTMKEKGGPKAFKVKNSVGITPSRYLKENLYAHVTEKEVIGKYVLQMMGEL